MTANEKNTGFTRMGSLLTAASVSLALVASCGGRSSSDAIEGGRTANSIETQSAALLDSASPVHEDDVVSPVIPDDLFTADAFSETAVYQVTVRNFWGPDDFPQDFPDGAHLSLFGGAIHNASVSFWQIGEPPSRGIEDMAEAGLIDILLSDDVSPAIAQGTASSFVEVRRFTESSIDGEPGTLEFEASLTRSHPLITMTSMLGPSPDWFVGVHGQTLLSADGSFVDRLVIDLPAYDAGTDDGTQFASADIDANPPQSIQLVTSDPLDSDFEFGLPILGQFIFERIDP